MTALSPLERAKTGDAEAIAHLLNQALASKGMTVQGERQGSCLILRLASQTLPNQNGVVTTIQRGIERLQVHSIDTIQIHYRQLQPPNAAWSKTISLVDSVAARSAVATTPTTHGHPGSQTASSSSPPSPQTPPSIEALTQTYESLKADPEASLQAVDEIYFQLRLALLRQYKRKEIDQLKAAHTLFKESRLKLIPESKPEPLPPPPDDLTLAVNLLPQVLRSRNLNGQARLHNSQLQIRLEPESAQKPNQATAIIYTLLEREDLEALRMAHVSDVVIYGLASAQKVGWKRVIPMPSPDSVDNRDLMSFKNSHINTFGFPILMLIGILMNAMPIINVLLWGIKIWFHELGHAAIAWLAGRRALPLPFGFTTVNPNRSLFVYFGLLILFGLMAWAGYREKKRWPMVLAGVLAIVQFGFTWLLPEYHFETLLSFGGIGGELYLCTLLMVSFYLPLPDYWRWDFYRYPVVVGAAFTFWGQIWLWRQIKRGAEDIPWGSMWGGEDYGDMNNLIAAGWSDQQIINTYSTIANLCLIALLSAYIYFGIKENRRYLFTLSQRWLARRS